MHTSIKKIQADERGAGTLGRFFGIVALRCRS
jgi:hypothetical protein